MNGADLYDILRESLWAMIKISAPIMLTGLVVGLVVSLIQALTQIQEMTLSFVPKILSIFFALLLCVPFMSASLITFTQHIYNRIVQLE